MSKKDGSHMRAVRVPNPIVGTWMRVGEGTYQAQAFVATRKIKVRRQKRDMEKWARAKKLVVKSHVKKDKISSGIDTLQLQSPIEESSSEAGSDFTHLKMWDS